MKKVTAQLPLSSIHSSSQGLDQRSLSTILKLLGDLDTSLSQALCSISPKSFSSSMDHARSLLFTLPSTLDEVMRRSGPVSLFSIRVALFSMVESDQLTTDEADQLAPLMRVLSVGELEQALVAWFKRVRQVDPQSENVKFDKRRQAKLERGLSMLFHSPRGHELFESICESERIELSGPWVRPMMRLANHELFPRHALLALYRSTSPILRPALLHQFERCRRRVRAKPLPAYTMIFVELDLFELELLFAHFAANEELTGLKTQLTHFPTHVQRAFDHAACSESEVS